MVFPILWILKDRGMIDRARKIQEKFVQEPFDTFYGEDGSTPFLSAFKPYKILLEISSVMEGEMESFNDEYYACSSASFLHKFMPNVCLMFLFSTKMKILKRIQKSFIWKDSV